MAYEKYQLPLLDGGMVTNISQALIDLTKGYMSNIYNMELSHYGLPQKRPGVSPVLPEIEKTITGIHEFIKTSTGDVYQIVAHGKQVQYWDDTAEEWVDIKDDFTADQLYSFLTFADSLLIVNGTDPSVRWDGDSLTEPGEFPVAKYLTDYRLRAVAAGDPDDPCMLYLSHTGDPTIWDPDEQGSNATKAYVSPDDGEGISGILNVGDGGLLIGKPSSIYGLFGYKRENFLIELIDPTVGVSSHKTMVYARPYAYWVHTSGIYRMESGGTAQRISLAIQDIFDAEVDKDQLELSRAVLYNRNYIVTLPTATGYITLVYHIDRESWAVWSHPVLGEVAKVSSHNIWFSAPQGVVVNTLVPGQLYDTLIDETEIEDYPIEALIDTKNLSLGVPEVEKDVKDLYLICRAGSNPYSVSVYIQPDQTDEWLPVAKQEPVTGLLGTPRVLRVPIGRTLRYHKVRVESLSDEFYPMSLTWYYSPKDVL